MDEGEEVHTPPIMFDVSDMPLPYNGILGRPALAKFSPVVNCCAACVACASEIGKLESEDALLAILLCCGCGGECILRCGDGLFSISPNP